MPKKSLLSALFGKPLTLIVLVAIVVGVAFVAQNVPTGFQTATSYTSSVTQKSTYTVTISWTQPTVSFNFYRLNQRVCNSGDSGWLWKGDIFSSDSRFTNRANTFTGLTTGACYDFRVIAMTGTSTSYSVAQFTSPAYISASTLTSTTTTTTTTSTTSTATTILKPAPVVSTASPTPNSVQLFWTTPSGLPSGSVYKVEVRPQTSEAFLTYLTTQSTATAISGLTPGTIYSFRVTAVTSTGLPLSTTSSPVSISTTSTTVSTTPSYTTAVTQSTPDSASVAWSAFSGTAFYRAQQRICGTGDPGWAKRLDITSSDARFTSRTFTYTGLTSGTCYDFRVVPFGGITTSPSVILDLVRIPIVSTTPSVAVTITPTPITGAPPTVTISHSPSSPKVGDAVTITATATPAQGANLVSRITIKVDDVSVTNVICASLATGAQSCRYSTSSLSAGTHTYFASALDNTEKLGTASGSVTVSPVATPTPITGAPPTVTISHSPSSPKVGDAVTITATATPAAGATLPSIINMKVDNAIVSARCASVVTGGQNCVYSTSTLTAGTHTYSATAVDNLEKLGTASGSVTVSPVAIAVEITDRANPRVVISVTPTSPLVGQDVTLTAAATDDAGLSAVEIYLDTTKVPATCSAPVIRQTATGAVVALQLIPLSVPTGAAIAGEGTTFPPPPDLGKSLVCTFKTKYPSAGEHTYYALARDTSDKQGRDPALGTRSFTVISLPTKADPVPPRVSVLHSPAEVSVGTPVTYIAKAIDDVGVTNLDIFVDGQKVLAKCSVGESIVPIPIQPPRSLTAAQTAAQATSKELTCLYRTVYESEGTHTYYSEATDSGNNKARDPESREKSVTIVSPRISDKEAPRISVSHILLGTQIATRTAEQREETITPPITPPRVPSAAQTVVAREGTATQTTGTTSPTTTTQREISRVGQQVLFTVKAIDNVALRNVELFVDNQKVNAACSATVGIPITPPPITPGERLPIEKVQPTSVRTPSGAAIAAPPQLPIVRNATTATATPAVTTTETTVQIPTSSAVSSSKEVTCSYTASLSVGPHSYYAVATDSAGNSARDPPTGAKGFTISSSGIITRFILAGQAQSQTTVALKWTSVDGAGSYRVQYKPAATITPPRVPSAQAISPPTLPIERNLTTIPPSDEGWITLGDVTANSYLAPVPKAGTYQFRVLAFARSPAIRVGGLTQLAVSNTITIDTTKVPIIRGKENVTIENPILLKAGTSTSDSIPLTWTAYSGAGLDRYIIQMKKSSETEFNVVSTSVPEKLSETISNLEASTEYNFIVHAVNSDNKILASSNVVTAKTAAPPIKDLTLSIGEVKRTKVELKWNTYNDPQLSYYTIQFRKVGEEIWKFKDNAQSTDTSKVIKQLWPKHDYEIKLLAMSGTPPTDGRLPIERGQPASVSRATGRAVQLPTLPITPQPVGTVIAESNVVTVTTATPPGLKARNGTVKSDSAEINWDVYSVGDDDEAAIPILFTLMLKEVGVDTDFNAVSEVQSTETFFEIKSLKENTDYEARVDVYGIGSTYYIGSSNSVPFTTGSDPSNQPPVANAGNDKNCRQNNPCNFDGSASYDPDGTITSYVWNFGDGSSATGVTTNHVYSTEGEYIVTLAVTDDKGTQANDGLSVTVPPRGGDQPIPTIDANPTSGNAPLPVSFSAQGSVDNGVIEVYDWDFGDGQSGSGEIASHTYTDAGTYIVSLIVIDDDGYAASAEETITVTSTAPDVNDPPVANAGADVICLVNVPCNIDGSGSTDPDPEDVNLLTYLWDFGDGTIQEAGISVGHTFTTPGTYTITLTVTDPGNAFSIDSAEIIVEANPGVDPQSPLAVIDAYPTSGTVPLVVSFDASGSSDPDNEIVSYDWDFGDGELGNGITTTHTYTSSGSYIVFLTATDATGQIGTTVIQIAVGEADLDEPYIDPTPELGGELVDVTLTGGFGAGTGGFGSGPPIFPTQPRIGDTDGDLIPDNLDACPGTSPSETVTANGCPLGSAPAKATCTPDDFKRERVLIGVDVSSIANSCGLSGNWKVDIFRTEPTNVEVASSTASAQTISIPDIFGTIPNVPSSIDISSFALPPPRDSCSQIVPGWRAGVDVHRVYCGIDNQWYYVSYAASFKQE